MKIKFIVIFGMVIMCVVLGYFVLTSKSSVDNVRAHEQDLRTRIVRLQDQLQDAQINLEIVREKIRYAIVPSSEK